VPSVFKVDKPPQYFSQVGAYARLRVGLLELRQLPDNNDTEFTLSS